MDADEVMAANQAFYDAHEQRDLAAMTAVWDNSERAVCVHPGWPILRGWPAVEESWRGIFGGPGRNQFIVTNDAVAVEGDLAWVTLDENLVDVAAHGHHRRDQPLRSHRVGMEAGAAPRLAGDVPRLRPRLR